MSKKIVVMPDVQAPYEDRRAVKAFIRFVGEYQPDELVCIGDLADYPQPSRWTKNTREEFEGDVFEDSAYIRRTILVPIRNVFDGRFSFIEGNHDERPRAYLEKYAPALAKTREFHVSQLLDFEGFGVEQVDDFYDFAPGWTMTHGHKGRISLSQISGNTAANAARRFQRSLVMGHTHRMGISSNTHGYGGTVTRTITGVEVGHLMDMKRAGYLKGGTANWQKGFCVIRVSGNYVQPVLVPIDKGKFSVEGVTYDV